MSCQQQSLAGTKLQVVIPGSKCHKQVIELLPGPRGYYSGGVVHSLAVGLHVLLKACLVMHMLCNNVSMSGP